jgi:hypothetical protein
VPVWAALLLSPTCFQEFIMIVNLNTVVPDKLVCREGKRREELVDIGGIGLYCEVRVW